MQELQRGPKNLDMFIILTVAVVSWVYTYVKTLNYVLTMFHLPYVIILQ